jgi:hypothetical protein
MRISFSSLASRKLHGGRRNEKCKFKRRLREPVREDPQRFSRERLTMAISFLADPFKEKPDNKNVNERMLTMPMMHQTKNVQTPRKWQSAG